MFWMCVMKSSQSTHFCLFQVNWNISFIFVLISIFFFSHLVQPPCTWRHERHTHLESQKLQTYLGVNPREYWDFVALFYRCLAAPLILFIFGAVMCWMCQPWLDTDIFYTHAHNHTSFTRSDPPTLPFASVFIIVSVLELECPLNC